MTDRQRRIAQTTDAPEGDGAHHIAWVPASAPLGYSGSTQEPRELGEFRRVCSEAERQGFRLVSVSEFVGVIDPALGGMGTLGWYLFFVRQAGEGRASERRPRRGVPDYLRRGGGDRK